MARELREYQKQAGAAVTKAYADGLYRCGVGLPTGTGKTDVISSLARDVYAVGNRSVVLVHRDVLVQQLVDRLDHYAPNRAVGVVQGPNNAVDAPIVVASIQTLSRPGRLAQLRVPDVTFVDEAHVSVSTMYHAYYEHVDAVPGGSGHLAGFTATWMRSDKLGLGDVWQEVVFRRSLKWAVRNGHLVEPKAVQIGTGIDLSDVRTVTDHRSGNYGDYNTDDLQDVVMVEDVLQAAVDGYHALAPGSSAVLFAPTQRTARFFAEGLRTGMNGRHPPVSVGEILAGTPKAERAWNLSCFDTGGMKVLVTCNAISVGWDAPRCSTMICVRPTTSELWLTQAVGRILRPWPGKRCGLVLDAVGVTDDKTLAGVVDLSKTPEGVERETSDPCGTCGRARCSDCDGCRNGACAERGCWCDGPDDHEREPRKHTAKRIVGAREVDLFAGTNARWLTTRNGVPFVQTKLHTYFIAPVDGAWSVGCCGATSIHGARWLAGGLSSDDALETGSELALAEDPSIADKRSRWRSGPASPAQVAHARRMGLSVDGLDKSALSDAMSIHVASGLLANIRGV